MSRRSRLLTPVRTVCMAAITCLSAGWLAPQSAEAGFGILFPRHHAPVAAYRPVVAPVAAPVAVASRVPYAAARPVLPVAPAARAAVVPRPYGVARYGYSSYYAAPTIPAAPTVPAVTPAYGSYRYGYGVAPAPYLGW